MRERKREGDYMNTELFHKKSKRILILMTVKKHSEVFLRKRSLSERNCRRNKLAMTVVETKSADIYTDTIAPRKRNVAALDSTSTKKSWRRILHERREWQTGNREIGATNCQYCRIMPINRLPIADHSRPRVLVKWIKAYVQWRESLAWKYFNEIILEYTCVSLWLRRIK